MKKFFDKFSDLKGAKFIGIRGYTNQKGEIADLSVLVNFDYKNTVKKDLKTLRLLSEKDLKNIAETIDYPLSSNDKINYIIEAKKIIELQDPPDGEGELSFRKLLNKLNSKALTSLYDGYVKLINEKGVKIEITKDNSVILETLRLALSELIESFENNLTEDQKTNQSVAQTDAYFHLTKGVKMHKETMNVFVYGLLNHKTIHVHGEYPARKKSIKTVCKEAIKNYCQLRSDKYRQYNIGKWDKLNISGTSFVKEIKIINLL